MQISEEQVRQQLIDKLLALGYPKSSIVLELGLAIGRNSQARIDLAIKDPDTNQLLAIFEIKRNLRDIDSATQQVLSYTKLFSGSVQAFIYGYIDGSEKIYSVNSKNNDVSQVFDLPSYDSLKNVETILDLSSKKQKARKQNSARNWSTIVAGMTSSVAIAATAAMVFGLLFDESKTLNNAELTEKIYSIQSERENIVKELNSLKTELKISKSSLEAISKVPDEHGWKSEASRISSSIERLDSRLEALENAITEDPAKALAVPILRKDLDNAEKSLKAELIQTKSEIDRMYDQNKWFIGLMFTIALSVLGMAASSFFNRKDT
ncbi:hypothetical protein F3I62_18760 [Pseudomonas sp. R-28-1W-6]|uniref:type I restriction enzyme HsdR N-terminal domain-containing protein n=1 Tax=Pseudomonas sp. R-28-1W-6 TaxID=2650101 RepID=UPI0013660B63|nr:hypothetical protein [Pseudomonas sp. R-28-1W-6]